MKKQTGPDGPKRPRKAHSPTLKNEAEKIALVEKICSAYENDDVTLASCCETHGISSRTFQNYCDQISQCAERFKIAKSNQYKLGREGIKQKALDGLKRLLVGFYVDEPETETTQIKDKSGNVKQTITRTKTKKRYIAPNPTAIIFALKNVDPENWNEDKFSNEETAAQVFKIGEQTIVF